MSGSHPPAVGVRLDATGKKVAFQAYGEPLKRKRQWRDSTFKIGLVAGDCTLLGLQPVLVHMSKNSLGAYSFNPVAVNFLTEVAKTLFALITLLAVGTGRAGPPMYRSVRSFVADARHNLLLAVPAALYAVNNYLKFAMQLYFKPTTTKMLGNLKVFTIALLMRTILQRRFSVIQYEALFLLVAGITINQLQCNNAGADVLTAAQLVPAALCVLGSVTVPSAASVYNEYALKRHMDTSVHLQNFFLYFFGALFNLLGVAAICAWKHQGLAAFFSGQSGVTIALIVNNAAQGILSSFFYKYADTILKKYSSTIATILTAVLSWVAFSHPLTVNFGVGVSIVLISMHQFFTFGGPKSGDKGGEKGEEKGDAAGGGGDGGSIVHSPSMDHLLVKGAGEAAPLLPR